MAKLRQDCVEDQPETSPPLRKSQVAVIEALPADPLACRWPDLLEQIQRWTMSNGLDAGSTRELAAGLLRDQLRWTRPDGSSVFGGRGKHPERLKTLRGWAAWVDEPALVTVVNWWCPTNPINPEGMPSAPPLPAAAHPDIPHAVLRPDWTARGDLVAIDHREAGSTSKVEVSSRGFTWVGPTWTSPGVASARVLPRPTHWSTGAFADCAEWSFVVGRVPTTRTALLLRSRGLTLLAQQFEGADPTAEIRLELPDGIQATPDLATRSLILSAGKGKPTVRLVPLGLPATPYVTDRGSILVEGREVVIRQRGEGRRRWLPVLICRDKAPTFWRTLTVSSRSTECRPEDAFAVRVAWGKGDPGLVIYRSLAAPDLRAFFGHQTKARFLVGSFDKTGDVRPIFKIDG